MDDEVAYLSILDTAGQEEFSVYGFPLPFSCICGADYCMGTDAALSLRDQYMRSGEGFVLVYDITSLHSFDEISKIHEHIYRARDSIPEECHVPTVILGNKCDLEHLRQVSTFAGQEMAKNLKAKFFECSAKTRVNIDEAFYEIIREIRHARRPQMNDKKKEKPGKKIGGCIIL